MPPLDRALPLTQGDRRAVIVGKDLHLDVARMLEIALQVDVRAAEGALRRSSAGFERRGEIIGPLGDPHADAATAGGRLDHHRVADPFRLGDRGRFVGERGRPRYHGDARGDHPATGLDLVAHRPHARRRGSDEGQPAFGAGLRERRVFGEKAITRMDRIGAVLARRAHDLLHVEIGVSRCRPAQHRPLLGKESVGRASVRLRVDGDGPDGHLAAGSHHAKRDLAAVRDQNLGDASQSSSTLRWGRRSLPLWRRPPAPSRRPSPRCRSASSSPPAPRPRRPAGRGHRI